MSKFKKHLKAGLLLVVAAAFAVGCARSSKTKFAQNMENDAGKPAPTYEEWVALVGQDKTDQLYAGIGQDSLNLLLYGIGQSNMVQLINAVASPPKLIALVGNDFIAGAAGETGPGGMTGLGTMVTLNLVKQVDEQMQTNLSTNLLGGGGVPGETDTIANLSNIVNTLGLAEINQKLVYMFGPAGFNVARNLTGANDTMFVGRLAKVVAHVTPGSPLCSTKLCPLIQGLSGGVGGDITERLVPLMSYNTGAGVAWANKLVEIVETTTTTTNLITVIQGVTVPNITAKMAVIVDNVTDCTKMGYTINSVITLGTLVSLINNVSNPLRMGTLINSIEDAATWTAIGSANWTGGQQTWGSPTKAAPWGTAGSGATINFTQAGGIITAVNVVTQGTNYHPDVTITGPAVWTGCASTPKINLTIAAGLITGATIANNGGSGCTIASGALTLTDPINTSGMARLVSMINTITPANYFQMLSLIDSVATMNKLVLLIQDVQNVSDVIQMLNQMTPVGVTPGGACTGVLTITGGTFTTQATAEGFVSAVPAANSFNHIAVTNGGAYTAGSPPTGISDTGCGVLAPASYTIVMNTAGTAVDGIYFNALPVNSMAEMVQNITMANTPRLVQVVNGQRIFDNTGTQAPAATNATYLNKMVALISNLNVPSQGPIKVTQMINGVTNTDKIIDLIYGVTNVANLSTIINNVFPAVPSPNMGCSDALVSTYLTPATCDQGATTVAGNGYIWGDRSHAIDMLVYTLERTSNISNLIKLVNGSSPANVAALINHVSTADGTIVTQPSSQIEDTAALNPGCPACVGAVANTSTSFGGGAKLINILDHSTPYALDAYDLAFMLNKVTSTTKMAKLIINMPIGQTTPGLTTFTATTLGTGKIGDVVSRVTSAPVAAAGVASQGNCFSQSGVISANITAAGAGYTYAPTVTFACNATVVAVAEINPAGAITSINVTDPGTGGGCAASAAATLTPALGGAAATANIGHCTTSRGLAQTGANAISNIGKGKMVNMVNYVSGASDTAAMQQLATVLNSINDSQKLGDLINKVSRSSNVVALLNAVIDSANNTSTTQLVDLMNSMTTSEIHKLIALVQQLNPAVETTTDTLGGMDQQLVAQLLAPYAVDSNVTTGAVAAATIMPAATPGKVVWAAHGLANGRKVVFSTTGTLPASLVPSQVYFVKNATAGDFEVSATPGGASLAFVTSGAGNHTAFSNDPTAASGLGQPRMTELMGSITSTNGSGFAAAPAITFGAGCGTTPVAAATVATGKVTGLAIGTNPGEDGDCTVLPSINTTGNASLGFVAMPIANRTGGASGANNNVRLKSVFIRDGGSGYGAAPGVTYTGSTCGTPPTVTATINGLSSIDLSNPGANCTTNPAVTITPANGATATAYVAGSLASLIDLYGGRNYTTGETCPIQGSGGTGGTVVVTAAVSPGPITSLGAIVGGNDYMVDQTVTIGGAARGHALVTAAGVINAGAGQIIVDYSGCGYTAATVTVTGCTVNPTATATVGGGLVTGITVTGAGSGCPRNPNVIITGAHGDGATARVATVTNGTVVLISLSPGADNLASVLSNQEKAPLGLAVNYGSNQPTIGAREAMVRLLYHGITYNGANFPGVGPAHLGYNVMSALTSGVPVMTVINMMNNDTTSLADLGTLIGCGDKVEFGVIAPITSNDFEAICRTNHIW